MIVSCEEHYREIYRQHGESITVEFPKHYPTSALIGCVDVVDVVPFQQLADMQIPSSVGFTASC